MRTSRKIVALTIGLIIGVTAIAITINQVNGTAPQPVFEETPILSVSTTTMQLTTLAEKVFANGNIMAWQEAIIGTEVNGLKLEKVHVNVGDEVKKGQILAAGLNETRMAPFKEGNNNFFEIREGKSNDIQYIIEDIFYIEIPKDSYKEISKMDKNFRIHIIVLPVLIKALCNMTSQNKDYSWYIMVEAWIDDYYKGGLDAFQRNFYKEDQPRTDLSRGEDFEYLAQLLLTKKDDEKSPITLFTDAFRKLNEGNDN